MVMVVLSWRDFISLQWQQNKTKSPFWTEVPEGEWLVLAHMVLCRICLGSWVPVSSAIYHAGDSRQVCDCLRWRVSLLFLLGEDSLLCSAENCASCPIGSEVACSFACLYKSLALGLLLSLDPFCLFGFYVEMGRISLCCPGLLFTLWPWVCCPLSFHHHGASQDHSHEIMLNSAIFMNLPQSP